MIRSSTLGWCGWGTTKEPVRLSDAFSAWIREELHLDPDAMPYAPRDMSDIDVPPSRLGDAEHALMNYSFRPDELSNPKQRLFHAAGRSYVDLLRLRSGERLRFPDGVVRPKSAEDVARLLGIAASEGIAVVPFGGGTSVVGGVEPLPGPFSASIALDCSKLGGIGTLDETNLTVRAGAGCRIRDVEEWCRKRGYAIGHYPQSYEFVTVGGSVATRSAGQSSHGYGKFDDIVVALETVTPSGPLSTRPHPRVSVGPSVHDLVLGSEGTLGIVTAATLRVHRAPTHVEYDAWLFPGFDDGIRAFREIGQGSYRAAVARLSDEEETAMLFRTGSHGGILEQLFSSYLYFRGYGSGALAIIGFEERSASALAEARNAVGALCSDHKAMSLGSKIGGAWERARYDSPYLRDRLLDIGVLAETFETATTWNDVKPLRDRIAHEVTSRLLQDGGSIGCHLSHLYPWGSSLYFTVLGSRVPGATAAIAQWEDEKKRIMDLIADSGAAASHHHGIGLDHAPWMDAETGATGMNMLMQVKRALDPSGILNPGKLLAESDGSHASAADKSSRRTQGGARLRP